MFQNELTQIGLSKEEAKVYESLLNAKELSVADLVKKTPYKKGNLYNIIDDLIAKGLVSKTKGSAKAYFEALHPNKIQELLENTERAFKKANTTMEAVLPDLLSAYNLAHEKPGVLFYEGLDGMKKIAYDSLTAKTEIVSFIDLEALKKHTK